MNGADRMGKLLSRISASFINAIVEKQLGRLDFVEDYTGTLHSGMIARVPISGSTNADTGETLAYVRKGSTRNLIVLLMGGGVSWNAETANYSMNPESAAHPKTPALYAPSLSKMTEYSTFCLSKTPGLLSTGDENLFADWNLIVINYVTGDFHVGRHDYPYTDREGNQRILHHQGYSNFQKAMERCKAFFPETDKLLITGGSAGAFAVPALAADIMAYYPECDDVTVFSDSALLLMESYRTVARDVWGAEESLVEAIHSSDISADWFERLYAMKGESIRYLYANSAQDYLLATFQNYMDTGSYSVTQERCNKFKEDLRHHVQRLRNACPRMGFYISDHKPLQPKTAGTEHCMILNGNLSNKKNAPVCGMQWLYDAVNGKIYDVGMDLLSK